MGTFSSFRFAQLPLALPFQSPRFPFFGRLEDLPEPVIIDRDHQPHAGFYDIPFENPFIFILPVGPYHVAAVAAKFIIDPHIGADIVALPVGIFCSFQFKIAANGYLQPVIEEPL